MGLIDNKSETNKQLTVQSNINDQATINDARNSEKQINMQDYVTYLRNYTRNVEDMKQSFKQVVSSAADQVQRNNAIIEGCHTFKKKLTINQSNYNEQKVELGFENLAEISRQMKMGTNIDLSSTADADQGLDSNQTANSEQSSGSELGSSAAKESKQTEQFKLIREFKERFWNPSYTLKLVEHSGVLYEGGINITDQESIQTNENRQLSQSVLENNNELYDKISTAYDKASEIINEVNESIENEIDTSASATSIQENNFVVRGDESTGCGNIFSDDVNVTQSNTLKQIAILNVYLAQSNKSDVDATTAAMMADMLGLIQTAQAKQEIANVQEVSAELKSDDEQKSDQSIDQSQFTRIVIILIIAGVVCLLIPVLFKLFYSNSGGRNQRLMDYPEQNQ